MTLNGYLAQFLSVVIGFSRVSGVVFIVGCAALAISRICQVMAFFLPLKIFILFHSGDVPDYFNVFPEIMGYREVLLLLSVMVPVAYFLFVVLGIVYRWMIDLHLKCFDTNVLLVMGKEISDKKVSRLHNHVSKAFSDAGLVIVSIVVVMFLDVYLAVTLFALIYGNLWLFNNKAFGAEDRDRLTFLNLHRRQFIEYFSSTNFLLVFAILAVELAYFEMGVYTAIFLLLLSRMVFQALNRFSVESLYILKFLP